MERPDAAWAVPAEEVLDRLETEAENGLEPSEVESRREEFGANRLREASHRSAWQILWEQVKSVIILLLAIAVVVSLAFGQFVEAIAIAVVIVINAAIGFFTELRAVRSMEALQQLGQADSEVIRGGERQTVPAHELVPGDLVVLEQGEVVGVDLGDDEGHVVVGPGVRGVRGDHVAGLGERGLDPLGDAGEELLQGFRCGQAPDGAETGLRRRLLHGIDIVGHLLVRVRLHERAPHLREMPAGHLNLQAHLRGGLEAAARLVRSGALAEAASTSCGGGVAIGTELVDTVNNLVTAIRGSANFDPATATDHRVWAKDGNGTVLLLQGGTGPGSFNVDFSGLGNGVRQAGSGNTTFTVQQKAVTDPAIRFDAQGLPAAFGVNRMAVLDFVNGASDFNDVDLDADGDVDIKQIALDFGTPREGNGMTQFGADFTPAFIQQNGARFGTFAGVSVDHDGTVTALFDNGEIRPIYKIPVATFVNPNGMEGRTGNAWSATQFSGDPTLRVADSGPAGTVNQAALEASTVDIGEEFTDMIMVQRAYSAATRIISTSDEMLDELVRMKR